MTISISNLSLPSPIPANVAESLTAIKAKPYFTGNEPEYPRYGMKPVSDTLTAYLETLFPFPIRCIYSFERLGFPLRTQNNIDTRIQYVLDSGTADNSYIIHIFQSPGKIEESTTLTTNNWYAFDGSKFCYNQFDAEGVLITLDIIPLGTTAEITAFVESHTI